MYGPTINNNDISNQEALEVESKFSILGPSFFRYNLKNSKGIKTLQGIAERHPGTRLAVAIMQTDGVQKLNLKNAKKLINEVLGISNCEGSGPQAQPLVPVDFFILGNEINSPKNIPSPDVFAPWVLKIRECLNNNGFGDIPMAVSFTRGFAKPDGFPVTLMRELHKLPINTIQIFDLHMHTKWNGAAANFLAVTDFRKRIEKYFPKFVNAKIVTTETSTYTGKLLVRDKNGKLVEKVEFFQTPYQQEHFYSVSVLLALANDMPIWSVGNAADRLEFEGDKEGPFIKNGLFRRNDASDETPWTYSPKRSAPLFKFLSRVTEGVPLQNVKVDPQVGDPATLLRISIRGNRPSYAVFYSDYSKRPFDGKSSVKVKLPFKAPTDQVRVFQLRGVPLQWQSDDIEQLVPNSLYPVVNGVVSISLSNHVGLLIMPAQ